MENIKGFFRKKNIKIYMIIFTILILSIIVVYSLITHTDNFLNDYAYDHTFYLVTCKEDCSDSLKEKKYIKKIIKSYILKPDYDSKTFTRNGVIIKDYNTKDTTETIVEEPSKNKDNVYWGDFTHSNDEIYIYPASDYNYDISDGQVIINVSMNDIKNFEYYNQKTNQKIGLLDGSKKYEFTIKEFKNSNVSNFIISDNDFKKISEDKYIYKVVLKDYKDFFAVNNDFEKSYGEQNISRENSSNGIDNIQFKKDILLYLKLASFIIIFLMLIVFTVSINNLINDEKKNIYNLRTLGYNKFTVFLNEIISISLLFIMSFIIAVILSSIIFILINTFMKFSVEIINFIVIFKIFLLIMLIAIIELAIYSLKLKKFIK